MWQPPQEELTNLLAPGFILSPQGGNQAVCQDAEISLLIKCRTLDHSTKLSAHDLSTSYVSPLPEVNALIGLHAVKVYSMQIMKTMQKHFLLTDDRIIVVI